MSKLFKLKEWVTIKEAAQHLSIVLSEEVLEKDVLRLGVDRKLKISVNFLNQTSARKFNKVARENLKEHLLKISRKCKSESAQIIYITNNGVSASSMLNLSGSGFEKLIAHNLASIDENISDKGKKPHQIKQEIAICFFDHHAEYIDGNNTGLIGIYDFVHDNEVIMQEYSNLIDGPEANHYRSGPTGMLFQDLDGNLFCLADVKYADDFSSCEIRPRTELPDSTLLVVRTEELSSFCESLNTSSSSEKSLQTKERKSLHLIIAALIELAEYDIEHPYAAAKEIMYKIKESSHITENTVATHLKAARETAINP